MSKILPVTYELNYKIELQIATCRHHIYKEIWVPYMTDISPRIYWTELCVKQTEYNKNDICFFKSVDQISLIYLYTS